MSRPPFDSSEFESRLSWIFGSPRTGSTWLLRMLIHPWRLDSPWRADDHALSGICFSADDDARGRTHPNVVPVNESHFPRHLTPFVPPTGEEADGRDPDDYMFNTRVRGNVSYCFGSAFEDVWRPEVRRLILVRLHAQAERGAERFGLHAPRVVVKEPNGSYGAEPLMGLIPRAKLIFLIRDGRDVIDSQLSLHNRIRAKLWGRNVVRKEPDRLSFVRTHAHLWVNNTAAVDRAYEAHDPGLRMRLRYEELRADTLKTLVPLAEWLGDERDPDELREAVDEHAYESLPWAARTRGRLHRAATSGAWREGLKAEEQRVANEIMGEQLARFGYEV
jgi:hypothetical protein